VLDRWLESPSQLAKLVVIYSTSVKLDATKVCFLLNQAITADPKLKQHPKVLLQSVQLPAYSKYE